MSNFPVKLLESATTPAYAYDLGLLKQTLQTVVNSASIDSRFKVHYAVKANARAEILKLISTYGLGADCVSGGEVAAAIANGFSPEKITFAGVGKTNAEILLALNAGIGIFNVESLPEIDVINQLAAQLGVTANIALRVNPEIDAHTHHYITTGLSENKFGIPMLQLDEAITKAQHCSNINLKGLHFHIGSQITSFECYKLLCERINNIIADYSAKGIHFQSINVGGGLGIDYDSPDENPIPPFDNYFAIFANNLKLEPHQEVHFEPGRAIVAQCGSLITRVLYVKECPTRQFAIVDAGMTDLIRPALYQAHHAIELISDNDNRPEEQYDIVGPICESSDVFATDLAMPKLHRGDLLAIRSAGAYGEIMASQYNLRPLPGAIFYNI